MVGLVDAVDGSSTGTRVPRMWGRLRLPRFGGAIYAVDFDDWSRYRQVGLNAVSQRITALQMMRRPRSRGKGGWRDQLCGRIGDAGCDDLAVEVEHALHD